MPLVQKTLSELAANRQHCFDKIFRLYCNESQNPNEIARKNNFQNSGCIALVCIDNTKLRADTTCMTLAVSDKKH